MPIDQTARAVERCGWRHRYGRAIESTGRGETLNPLGDPRDRLRVAYAIASDLARHAGHRPTFPHRGFLLWKLSDAGGRTRRVVPQAAGIRNPSQSRKPPPMRSPRRAPGVAAGKVKPSPSVRTSCVAPIHFSSLRLTQASASSGAFLHTICEIYRVQVPAAVSTTTGGSAPVTNSGYRRRSS
jgi:hypothetical protein